MNRAMFTEMATKALGESQAWSFVFRGELERMLCGPETTCKTADGFLDSVADAKQTNQRKRAVRLAVEIGLIRYRPSCRAYQILPTTKGN